MSAALQEAFEKAAALSLERQETIAAVVLEEIEAEDHWQRSFAQSQNVLSQLAAEVPFPKRESGRNS
jgi:predicted amidophosphoribosyltransferase